jgi:flagellar basal body P-ring protein FlgI
MTVNKSQGQIIPNVGVYLHEPVFSHGELYVVMSRATCRNNIKILAVPPNVAAEEEKVKLNEEKSKGKQTQAQVLEKFKQNLSRANGTYPKYCIKVGPYAIASF